MTDGVREEKRIGDVARDGHRFFIERKRIGAAAEVAVDLGDAFERIDELAARPTLARLLRGLGEQGARFLGLRKPRASCTANRGGLYRSEEHTSELQSRE